MSAWAVFMVFVGNQERLSSSIMQQIMSTIRENAELREVIGEAVRPEPVWWMNGDPWINGAVRFLDATGVDVEEREADRADVADPYTWWQH